VPGAAHHDLEALDDDGRLRRAHSDPFDRSMPAAARANPSPTRPVPTVRRAIASIGSTTPQGWSVPSATWFSWIIRPQSAPFGVGVKPRKAREAISATA